MRRLANCSLNVGVGQRDARRYERHRPEGTLLYRLVEQHYPEFAEAMATQGKPLPAYVEREFEDYLKCGHLEQGFFACALRGLSR